MVFQSAPLDPVTAALVGVIITSLATLLATIGGFVFTYVMTERKATRDEKAREILAAKEKEDRAILAAKEAEDRARADVSRAALKVAVDDNTAKTMATGEKADSAYHEANTVNNKMADLQEQNKALHEEVRGLLLRLEQAEGAKDKAPERVEVVNPDPLPVIESGQKEKP